MKYDRKSLLTWLTMVVIFVAVLGCETPFVTNPDSEPERGEDNIAPTFVLEPITVGSVERIFIRARETIKMVDGISALAGEPDYHIKVFLKKTGAAERTENIAFAANITEDENAIEIDIDQKSVREGDIFYIEVAAGIVQDSAGNVNPSYSGENFELSYTFRDLGNPTIASVRGEEGTDYILITFDEDITLSHTRGEGLTVYMGNPVLLTAAMEIDILKSFAYDKFLVLTLNSPLVAGNGLYLYIDDNTVYDTAVVPNGNNAVLQAGTISNEEPFIVDVEVRYVPNNPDTVVLTYSENVVLVGTGDNIEHSGVINVANIAAAGDSLTLTLDDEVENGDGLSIDSGLVNDGTVTNSSPAAEVILRTPFVLDTTVDGDGITASRSNIVITLTFTKSIDNIPGTTDNPSRYVYTSVGGTEEIQTITITDNNLEFTFNDIIQNGFSLLISPGIVKSIHGDYFVGTIVVP